MRACLHVSMHETSAPAAGAVVAATRAINQRLAVLRVLELTKVKVETYLVS